jgi:hypothetical protein
MKRSFFLRRSPFGQDLASFFAFYGIVFIPFGFYLSNAQSSFTGLVFGKLISFISANLFGRPLPDSRIYSDSTSMYILVLALFVLSLITASLVPQWKKWPEHRSKVMRFIYRLCQYYLALLLLKYGVDKIFKNQFYLPEPNTLYTPLGELEKDILYWSSMGTSHFYSVFMGMLEAIAAIFLLFRKTKLMGMLISLVVMLNVVAVNFGFDIGVKVYSLFLLFITLYLLNPFAARLYLFLTQQKTTGPVSAAPGKKTFWISSLKWLVIGLILLEAVYPFLKTMVFNGDSARRPRLHGAYEVRTMIRGNDTLYPGDFPFKRFFFHRDSYMIFQDQQENMKDYKFSFDYNNADTVTLIDYDMSKTCLYIDYPEQEDMITIKYIKNGQLSHLTAKKLDWRNLPALKKGFHWTTD